MMDSRWQKVLDELEKDVESHKIAAVANQLAIDVIRKRLGDGDADRERPVSNHEIQFAPTETSPSAEARAVKRSEEARKKMASAQKRRWARYRAQKRKAAHESKK